MAINIVEDIKSVTDLKTHAREVLEQLHRTGRPVVITVSGKPDAVLMAAEEYERQRAALDLAHLLGEGEADLRAGRVRPAEEFLQEISGDREVARRDRRQRRA